MKRTEEPGAPVRCGCVDEDPGVAQRFDFAQTRIRDRINASVLLLKQALGRTVYWERSLGWILSRSILLLAVVIAIGVIGAHAPRSEVGLVEYKYVTGMNDGKVHLLMLNDDINASAIAEKPETDSRVDSKTLVVDRIMENEIAQTYYDIEYRASIRSPTTHRSEIFVLSRDIFNTLEIGTYMKFEIDRARGNRIRKLIAEDKRIKSKDDYFPRVQSIRQHMYQ